MDFIKPCEHCGSDNHVVDYAHGDTVCRDCGTVMDERLMMFDVDSNTSWCNDTHNFYYADDGSAKAAHQPPSAVAAGAGAISSAPPVSASAADPNSNAGKVLDTILRSLHMQDSFIAQHAHELRARIMSAHCFKGRPMVAAMACCVYLACKDSKQMRIPRSATEIIERLGLEAKVFHKVLKDINNMMPTCTEPQQHVSEHDTVIRQMQQLEDIPDAMYFPLARRIQAMDDIRKEKKYMIVSAPTIVNAVLILLACEEQDIKIDKNKMVSLGWISTATLKKHTKTIRAWL